MYFSIAKIYALANDRAMQRILASDVESGKRGSGILLMPIVIESQFTLTDSILKKFRQKIEHALQLPATVDAIKGTQSGIWGLFSDLLVVSWAYDSHRAEDAAKAQQDAQQLSAQLAALLKEAGAPNDVGLRCTMHEGILNIDQPMANQWRGLFAQAVIKLDILERDVA
jgi:hypothetical protein